MDLHAPLRSGSPPPRRHWRVVWAAAAIAAAGCLGAWFLIATDPKGGEPYAVALIPPPPAAKPPGATADPMPTGSIAPLGPSERDSVRIENGVKVVSPGEAESPTTRDTGPVVIDVSKALDSAARKGSPRTGGARSSEPTVTNGTRPRIALFIGALGLSDAPTQMATQTMPAAVTLAFVPYGTGVASAVATAKARGHEILLQLPMQSAQGTTSGPHTLTTTETGAEFTADLGWLTSRFDGYVGLTNLLGAPVTANSNAMTAVLKSAATRGVFYVDDGTSRRSLALSIGRSLGVPTLQADVVLDATGDPAIVQANLERLVTIARTKGTAIGMASGLSDHLGVVGSFARQLDGRGFTLVPLGVLARESTNLATNR